VRAALRRHDGGFDDPALLAVVAKKLTGRWFFRMVATVMMFLARYQVFSQRRLHATRALISKFGYNTRIVPAFSETSIHYLASAHLL
jgi:hypothetical protein